MSNPASMPVQQNAQTNNAKYVSIIPENGQEFKPQQKIIFNLEPSLGWIKGRDSYIVFDIENDGANKLKTTLRNGGISSIIKQVNIFSSTNGMLLETLDDYNQWTATEMQYRFDDPTNLTNVEGCPVKLQPVKGLTASGTNVQNYKNWENTFSQVASHRLTPTDDTGNLLSNQVVRFCMPLRCGIFRHWDTETLVPVLQMGGLRIEIVLASPIEALDMPWAGAEFRADGSEGGHPSANVGKQMKVDNFVNNATTLVISSSMKNVNLSGLCVGNTITINYTPNGGALTNIDRTINSMAIVGGKVQITTTAMTPACDDGNGLVSISLNSLNDANISYIVRNCEMRLLQEMPPDTKMSNLDYVFTSYDLFRDTIPQSQTHFNQDITSVASKAVSIFTMYENPAYDSTASFPNSTYHEGINPDDDGINLNSLVYFINNKLYPLRAYNPSRFADRVINQNEVVKAFGTLNIAVKNLGSSSYADLGNYTNRYLHARELARGNSVFNLQNAEPQIRLGFSGARGTDRLSQQVGNLRMKTYVFSKKILHIDGESGLTLEH